MNIANCITFFVEKLVELMSSTPVFPFVGFALAACLLDFIISFVRK